MLRREDCSGVWVPLVTPFRDEALALDLVPALVEKHLEAGVQGFLALGTTGEAPHVADDEAPRIVRSIVDAAGGRVPVLAGCGRPSTTATIALGSRLADAGAAGLLVLTPHVYRAASSGPTLRAHFERVASSLPAPVFVYHMPDLTGLELESALLVDLVAVPNVWGFKDSSSAGGPLAAALTAAKSVQTEGPVGFVGSAPRLVAGLDAGASGAILAVANVAPELAVEIYVAWKRGDRARAESLQTRLTSLVYGLRPWGLGGLKAAMRARGWEAGTVRSPLTMPATADRARIEALVQEALALEPR